MKELIYSFRENNVRVVMKDNEPWFILKDICEILEINNPSDVVKRIPNKNIHLDSIEGNKGNRNAYLINEYGVYEVIFSSRKKQANDFKRWVFEEVLPSIRKNGIYATPETVDKMLDDPQFIIDVLSKLKLEQEKRKLAESTVSILTHVSKTYNATEIAKELGFKSAVSLNNDLVKRKIQFMQNGTWLLYSKYADKGYVDIKQDVLDNGKVVYHRKWTQLGREFLLKLYEVE